MLDMAQFIDLSLNHMSSVSDRNKYDILKRYVAGERDFSQINLIGINLTGAVLKSVNLDLADLSLTNLTKINLSDSSLVQIILSQAILVNANLRRSNLQQANLSEANLKQAFLEEANLKEANLEGAFLEGAFLHKASLQGANFRGVKLENSIVESAYYDRNTLFDDSFDPVAAGMILLGDRQTKESPESSNSNRPENLEFLSGNLAKDTQSFKAFLEKERNNSFLVNKISSLLKSKPPQDNKDS
jgi:Pentapeptide repeats (8 copies)